MVVDIPKNIKFKRARNKRWKMKKILAVGLLLLAVVIGAVTIPQKNPEPEYLRIHIRANSNLEVDQAVKYEIKDLVVAQLSPLLVNASNKEEAEKIVEKNSRFIKTICDDKLKEKGFNYTANIRISNEYFPTRSYENVTLQSGYYDAVIVELGDAVGDNWWCVMYPPLCFVNKNENTMQIKYKSKIVEFFCSIFG